MSESENKHVIARVRQVGKQELTALGKAYEDALIEQQKNQRYKHQDMTELNGDGNRERGHYGEDLSQKE